MTVGETERAAPNIGDRGPLDVGLVSVIVPHLNDYENLDACLTLLEAQSFPGDRTEVIIADNGSSRGLDAVRAMVGTRGRVIEVAERGAGPARALALRRATRSRSLTAIVDRTPAGSRKASPSCGSRISPADGSTFSLKILCE